MEKYEDTQQLMRQQQAAGGTFTSTTVNGLRYTLTTDRREYHRGDQVRITFTKCNVSSRTITLNYPSGRRFEIAALRNGREVWSWSGSGGQGSGQRGGTERLRPGECRTYRATWDLRDRRGNYVEQGTYTIRAENTAVQLRNRFVQTRVEVVTRPTPPTPPTNRCQRTNMLANPGFEDWVSPSNPRYWTANNVRRSEISQSGRFAAELGADSGREASLRQSVPVGGRLNYQVTFRARERIKGSGLGRYALDATIYLYDRQGRFIGRIDPSYSPSSIPDRNFQQFRFTTGVLPAGADRAELRLTFRPRTGNTNSVIIDNVEMVCVSR